LVTAPGASQRETGPITIRKGDVVEARTTTRTGKVLSFFGVMLLVFGLLQSGADASGGGGNGKGKSAAPGQAKKAPASADVAASSSANTDCGSYCSTSDGTPSANGNGGGNANGKPCAGCVGNADNKNPPGQYKDGSDHNNGYECDGNNGVGKGNPAHSGCKPTTTVPCTGQHCVTTTTQPQQTTTTQPQQTTTTQPQQTTTTQPTTTTTAAGATTTTVAGVTTTTAEVLGVQFSRGDEQARGLASTGAPYFRPFTMLGALLLLIGVALMTIKVRPMARA
jgi:hypothetical protein